MQYIYHLKPGDMRGDTLYPLNQLKEHYPDVYERQIAKYNDHEGRKKLPLRTIPKLNCLWNDVVQCAPLHPRLIYQALQERDFQVKPSVQCFQISLDKIKHLPVVVYHSSGKTGVLETIPDELISWFDFDDYQELTVLPDDTLAWYDRIKGDRAFGHFVGVPHILIHGVIDISDVEVIAWDV